ncbi:MAG TPA: hypothetical protein ENO05_00920 [Bacteroides sp.]|nr:hypothetical protein [Bacteroides sp.]
MKSKLIVIVFLCIGTYVLPQSKKFLLQGSYDYVLYPFLNYENHHNINSYKLGGTATYYFTNRISFASGFHYEVANYKVKYPLNNSPALRLTSEKVTLAYVGVPILLEIKTLYTTFHLLSIQTGFELESLVSKEIVLSYNDGSTRDGSNDTYVHNFINCLSLGVAYRYIFLNHYFAGACPKVRYNLTSHGISTGESTSLSFLFQLSLGYLFDFD